MIEADADSRWTDSTLAAALFAVDPAGLGGIALRALPGPVRNGWFDLLHDSLPSGAPLRRIPLHVSDSRLLGGIDLSATLRAGRPVAETGLLVEANNGVAILAMADCVTAATAARLITVLDTNEVTLERDGIAKRTATRFGIVAIDEGMSEDEHPPAALLDRLAFHVDLNSIDVRAMIGVAHSPDDIAAARVRLPDVHASQAVLEALCATALALGIASLRAPLHALRTARALAALAARSDVGTDEAEQAARLVFASRATQLPAPAPDSQEQDDQTDAETDSAQTTTEESESADSADAAQPLSDVVLSAVKSAIPPGLLDRLRGAPASQARRSTAGRAGALHKSRLRGRPAGTLRGELRAGARLNVIETLRAAAPWQRIRNRTSSRIQVRPSDFRITRFKQRAQTTTIFVVDASGSTALHRLAEAKGAVELLLADSYVRRDRVALIAFRAQGAELLLPPTRSLVRAKRSLSGLPGGGGTPLAAGIDAAAMLADTLHRRGDTPIVVFLTDGQANIARDGSASRSRATEDSTSAARQLRGAGFAAVLIDTSPRRQPQAEQLAKHMGARYLPLPHADAAMLSRAVKSTRIAT